MGGRRGWVRQLIRKVFEEQDGAMLAQQQLAMGRTTDVFALHPINIEPEEAASRARRILARMTREENDVL